MELKRTKVLHFRAVKLIHGYGSSGAGGKIRIAVRRQLLDLLRQGQIKAFIPGESFSIFDETTRKGLTYCPALRKDPDLDRYNNGITVVLL